MTGICPFQILLVSNVALSFCFATVDRIYSTLLITLSACVSKRARVPDYVDDDSIPVYVVPATACCWEWESFSPGAGSFAKVNENSRPFWFIGLNLKGLTSRDGENCVLQYGKVWCIYSYYLFTYLARGLLLYVDKVSERREIWLRYSVRWPLNLIVYCTRTGP